MMQIMHACVATPAGTAALRDLEAADIARIVGYWHAGGADLQFLGIDEALLGREDDTRQRFARALRSGDPEQASLAFAITLDGEFAGYTLLNRYGPDVNYSHWHITDSRHRARGLSSALYPHRIRMYFDLVAIARLIHQTRTRNTGVNRMLDRFVPVAETGYVERPDGVALPGHFHTRYVGREDVPRLFEIASRRRETRGA